jgi:lysozyme
MAAPMSLSAGGLESIARIERFEPNIYRDQAGYDTIGYGHKLLPSELQQYQNGITEADARQLLAQDVGVAERAVNRLVSVPLTQNQFDALVSFTYNAGVGAFTNSTLLSQLNSGNYDGAAGQFGRWNKITIGGQKVESRGLTNRRITEQCMFTGGC